MSRPRFALLVLALASVFCLGDMRGDDTPKTTKGDATVQPPDRLLKANPRFEKLPPEERTPEGVTEVTAVPRLLGRGMR